MSHYDGDSIYSPDTAQQQIVIARRQLDNEVAVHRQNMIVQQNAIDEAKRQLVAQKIRVSEQEAVNWRETNAIRTQQAEVENQQAMVKREKDMLADRERQLQVLEDQRRRNRTVSEVYIEDSFAMLSASAVVENLTNSSLRIRKHAMKNISTCIGGIQDSSLPFVRFTPQDIAPYLLPKLRVLVSSSNKPLDAIIQFAEEIVSAPPMAKALAHGGQSSRLADYLIETNESVSRLAICCLRQMVRMETSVVKPAYEAMALVIPHIPIPDSFHQSQHPSIDFVKEVAPRIVEDCFNNGLWLAVKPLVCHHITTIREIVLRKVVLLARQSDRNQDGIAEGHILGLLDPYYKVSSPPADVVDFFVELLPLVAERLCRRPVTIHWLLERLSDTNPRINITVIDAFRKCMVTNNPLVFHLFVEADLLGKLHEPPIQQSDAITKLICQFFPVLAIPYAQAKSAEGIVRFLDDSDPAVANACLSACIKIVESTLEDRTHLYSVASKLGFTKESTLRLYDHAMPAFCKDWATSGDYKMIVQHIQHSEQRIRLPAQHVWFDIVYNSSPARSKIVRDGLLDVVFELCSSQYDDAIILGAKCCSQMAIEITKAGVAPTQDLVALLNHPNILLRQAALRGIQLASESSDSNCQVLLEAEVFKALHIFFEAYSKDILEDSAYKILARLAPYLHTSLEACSGLLQLLESDSQIVQRAAREALSTITNTNCVKREKLRAVVLNRLELPTEQLIDYAVKAIQDWIGPDLARLNDFSTFFGLVEHSDRRVQSAALISLRQRLSNAEYQESLEKANVIYIIRSLANSDNPEALTFVTVALRALALILARNGHVDDIIKLLAHKEPKVRDGADTALEAISNGDVRDRKILLQGDIIERLAGHGENLEPTQAHLLGSIIPMLAFDYLEAGKLDVILGLVNHPQQQIRTAACKSVILIAGGTNEQRARLRDALLSRLDQASPSLREVAANCLSQSLAHDLVNDGDFVRIFRLFHHEDARVRGPIIAQLQVYIRESDEPGRRRLVDARILSATLQAYTSAKDDILDFLSNCVLPMLGPSFTQDNGGSTLLPLLTHEEQRLRVSAIQALRNATDSRYGNVENMAKAFVVGTLHPLTTSDDLICDLWCRILPKLAPYLTNRAEIDMLFESLNDDRGNVREAASEAISVLARTSETSRTFMLPSLLHSLENLSSVSTPSIAQAISLSGSAFVSCGKESELLYLILDGKDVAVAVAAVEATIQVLSKGSSFEHRQLVEANPDVLTVALRLHDRRSQRQVSLKLLQSIVIHLSYLLLLDVELAREMFSLFDDPDPGLSSALYQTWSSDPRVSENDNLPELLPLLFDDETIRNPSVTALLRELAPTMVHQLVSRRKLDILVKALKIKHINVVQSILQEICTVIQDSNENVKEWFVAEPLFISSIGEHLKGRDAIMRRDSSTIIGLLSSGSASRSGRIMNEGIGEYLSWIAVNGEKGAQQSSLQALYTLFMAAPDHAERLVSDSLPALCDILEQDDLSLGVYRSALRLLNEIVQQSPHSVVIDSGVVVYLVRWASPRYSITDAECKKYVFRICQHIAQSSDTGRQALINAEILTEILSLISSRIALEVVSACKILKALSHTGIFRQKIVSAGLKTSLEHIISPFRKSTLQTKEEKNVAQAAAKDALETLKSSKRYNVDPLLQFEVPQWSPDRNQSEVRQSERISNRNVPRRSASESIAVFDSDAPVFENQQEGGQRTARRLGHSRSFSEPNQTVVVRSVPFVRLSAVQEDLDIPESPQRSATVMEEELEYAQPGSSSVIGLQARPIRRASAGAIRRFPDDNHLTDDLSEGPRTLPPSYKPLASVSGSVRRPTGQGRAQDSLLSTPEELGLYGREEASTLRVNSRRSYKQTGSGSTSVRSGRKILSE